MKAINRTVYQEQIMLDFDKLLAGEKAVTLLCGSAGSGKTHLFSSLLPYFYKNKATVISAKSVQYSHNQDEVIIKLINEIIIKILLLPKESYSKVVGIYRDIMQKDLMYIISALPQARKVFDFIEDVDIQNLDRNFPKKALLNFLVISARIFYPMILHIDDLQWIDKLSLEIINAVLLKNGINIYLLLAFRDEQFNLSELELSKIRYREIKLSGFTVTQTAQYISDYKYENRLNSNINSKQVYLLTDGNPFYIKTFVDEIAKLESKNKENQEFINYELAFNIEKIIEDKLNLLNAKRRKIVESIACLGGETEITILKNALKYGDLISELKIISELGIISYDEKKVTMVHDIVNEYVYQKIKIKNKLIVGLLNNLLAFEKSAVNRIALVRLCSQLQNIKALNLNRELIFDIYQAAIIKKNITAFDQAIALFSLAESILSKYKVNDSWFEIQMDYMECLYLAKDIKAAEDKYNLIKSKADNIQLNKLNIVTLKCLTSSAHWEMVLKLGEELLTSYGESLSDFDFNQELEQFKRIYFYSNINNLIKTKRKLSIPKTELCFVLLTMLPAANRIDKITFQKIILKLVLINAYYDLSPYVSVIYALAIYILYYLLQDFPTALKLEKANLKLLEQTECIKTEAYSLIGTFTYHISNSYSDTVAILEKSIVHSRYEHEYIYSNYAIIFSMLTEFIQGTLLVDLQTKAHRYYRESNGAENYLTKYMSYIIFVYIESLVCGERIKIDIPKDRLAFHQTVYLNYDMLSLQRYFILSQLDEAYQLAESIEASVNMYVGFVLNDEYYFYSALTRLAYYQYLSAEKRQENLSIIEKHLAIYSLYAKQANISHQAKYILLDLEYNEKIKNQLVSEEAYHQALVLAEKDNNLALMALTNLLLARRHNKILRLAKFYAREAFFLYKRWGAEYIAKSVDTEFNIVEEQALTEMPNKLTTIAKNLYLLQSETELETVKLFAELLFDFSAVTRFLLLFEEDKDYYIYYDIVANKAQSIVLDKININHRDDINHAMIRYVFRSQEALLSQANQMNIFKSSDCNSGNDYIYVQPLFVKENMVSVIYIEACSEIDTQKIKELIDVFALRMLDKHVNHQVEQNDLKDNIQLTKKEKEIAKLIVKGYSNKEISKCSFISEGTCRNHISNIYKKLKVKNRLQALATLKKINF